MSDLTGLTGFAPPTSIAGFMGLLQAASFRGVPFKVVAARVKKGRRQALHEYPFRDGGWAEDMGRALRTYSFSGYLIGDAAPVMQLLLDNAVEAEGPGLLIHPTIGAVQVSVLSAGTAVHKDKMRVIEVAFEFIEQGGSLFPSVAIATAVAVLAAADTALTASGTDLRTAAVPAAAIGPVVTGEGAAVADSFAESVSLAGGDPTAIVGMAAALPVTDSATSYGRYGAGSASVMLPEGTTVASLQAGLATQRAALALAGAGAVSAAAGYSASTDMLGALAALVEAMRAGISDPSDQVRVLLTLAGFSFVDGFGGAVGVGAAAAAMRDAMADACRRAALVSLARASASYQPRSYNEAAALRVALTAALDVEITAAGDAGEDATYGALRALRAAVVQDLTVRGASLPSVVGVRFAMALPSLVMAQMLYRDASRADEITAESGAVHPAFCPVAFQALASGMQSIAVKTGSAGGGVLLARGSAAGVFHLAPPGVPVGLAVGSVTGGTAALSWALPANGGLPASYLVEFSLHGAAAWASAGSTIGLGYTVTGLSGLTAYDFRVSSVNAAGQSDPAGLVTGTTLINGPNAVTGLGASVGSPASSAVVVSWTASAADATHNAASGYAVSFRVTGTSGWTAFGSAVSAGPVSVTGLAHSTSYDFEVVASNAGGTAASGVVTLATLATAPNAVTGLAAVAGTPASSVAVVSWTASAVDGSHDAAVSYAVSYRVTGTSGWTAFGSPVSAGPVSVTGLAAATGYDFEVVASNTGGTAASGVVSLTTLANAPNAVTGLAVAAGSPASSVAAVSWTASAVDGTHGAATGYQVSYRVTGGSGWTAFGSAVSAGPVNVTGLAQSTGYDFEVVASNTGGSATSGVVSLTTALAAPNAPAIASVAPVTDGTTTKLTVTWAASVVDSGHGAATGYDLQYAVHGSGSWSVVTGASSGQVLTGLTAGTSYDVQVRGKNASAGSPGVWSGSTTASTYSTVMSWHTAPASTYVHASTGNAVNLYTTPNPAGTVGVNFTWSSSAATNTPVGATSYSRTSGSASGDNGYPIWTNVWGAYLTAPATAGTYYVWGVVGDGSGALVSSAVTVT